MEFKLTNDFCDISRDEMMDIEGGVVDILIIAGLIAGVAVVEYAVTAVAVGAYKDLENCYNNGYNSVISSAK